MSTACENDHWHLSPTDAEITQVYRLSMKSTEIHSFWHFPGKPATNRRRNSKHGGSQSWSHRGFRTCQKPNKNFWMPSTWWWLTRDVSYLHSFKHPRVKKRSISSSKIFTFCRIHFHLNIVSVRTLSKHGQNVRATPRPGVSAFIEDGIKFHWIHFPPWKETTNVSCEASSNVSSDRLSLELFLPLATALTSS